MFKFKIFVIKKPLEKVTSKKIYYLGKIAGNQDKFDRSISELNQMYTDVKYFHYN